MGMAIISDITAARALLPRGHSLDGSALVECRSTMGDGNLHVHMTQVAADNELTGRQIALQ